MRPLLLGPNPPRSFYRGSGRIAGFRGIPAAADPYFPEDWIASTTPRVQLTDGPTVLPDGRRPAPAIPPPPRRAPGRPSRVAGPGARGEVRRRSGGPGQAARRGGAAPAARTPRSGVRP